MAFPTIYECPTLNGMIYLDLMRIANRKIVRTLGFSALSRIYRPSLRLGITSSIPAAFYLKSLSVFIFKLRPEYACTSIPPVIPNHVALQKRRPRLPATSCLPPIRTWRPSEFRLNPLAASPWPADVKAPRLNLDIRRWKAKYSARAGAGLRRTPPRCRRPNPPPLP